MYLRTRYARRPDVAPALTIDRRSYPDDPLDDVSWAARIDCRVAEQDDGQVVGLLVYIKHRRSLEVARIAADHDKVVTALLLEDLRKLLVAPIYYLSVAVPEGDLVTQVFLRELGWECVGLRPDGQLQFVVFA